MDQNFKNPSFTIIFSTASNPPVADATASIPSLRVGSNASTPYTNLGGTHLTFASNNLEEILSAGDHPLIQPIGEG